MKSFFKNNSRGFTTTPNPSKLPRGLSRPGLVWGFTLMEVMVAVSIFAIVVTIGIVVLLTINTNYRKSQDDRTAIDSLTYALESMSRGIRTAQSWANTGNTGGSDFSFTDQDGSMIDYYLDTGRIFMNIAPSASSTLCFQATCTFPVTPENVEVENLYFTTFAGTGIQSYVQINIKGKVTNGRQVSDFAFQTGVSKRVLDSATPVI